MLHHNSEEFIPISSEYTSIQSEYTLNSMALVSYITNKAYNIYGSIMRTTWKKFGFVQGKVDLEFI